MLRVSWNLISFQKQIGLLCLFIILTSSSRISAEKETIVPAGAHIAVFTITGAIGPATTDYLVRSLDKAERAGATSAVIKIDTPGGLDAATRDIIKAILSSTLPIITFVHPAGARAASAGTYILYASHIAAMTPSTTLGAATPVSIGTPAFPSRPNSPSNSPAKEQENNEFDKNSDTNLPQTTMERKVINDAVAFIRGLANRHNRNEEWAEKAVKQAATLTASEALEKNVIDFIALDIDDLLKQVHLHEVQLDNERAIIKSKDLNPINYDPDWRNNLLAIITNPQIAYILLMVGLYGLVLEGYNPGALVPGVIGGICLITAFYALQVLPINYAGLALIILGVLLIVAETMAPSFGILGVGGVIATTLGSIMLIDSDIPGMQISYKVIGSFAIISSIVVLAILTAVGRSLRMQRIPMDQVMIGQTGIVDSYSHNQGLMHVDGELWRIKSNEKLHKGQEVKITSKQGLVLTVERSEENTHV